MNPNLSRSALLLALPLTVALPAASSARAAEDEASVLPPLPFSEAELFFELNDTDGDLGLHGSIDGEPWVILDVETPRDTLLLRVTPGGNLLLQGMTQLFFESAEPSFDELDPEEFFARFPAGFYEVSGLSLEGAEMESAARLSQVLADRVRNVTVAGQAAAENCDSSLPVVSDPVLIDWDPVTTHHPDLGASGPVAIERYQFFVERDNVKLAVDLPPDVTQFLVPSEILALGSEFKFEIIARTSRNNNTAVESCFIVE